MQINSPRANNFVFPDRGRVEEEEVVGRVLMEEVEGRLKVRRLDAIPTGEKSFRPGQRLLCAKMRSHDPRLR